MLPTHAFAGLLLGLLYALVVPEFAGIALAGGLLGGLVPDLDMYVGHRRTLHYPVYAPVLAVAAVPVALLVPTTLTVAVATLCVGAAVHSVMDVFGGGLELRPWEATVDRAVYDHYRDRWIPPRRWVRYDGAPEDLLLSVALAVPLLFSLGDPYDWLVVLGLGVGAVYTAVRRLLPGIAERVVAGVVANRLPGVLSVVPPRYLDD